MGRFRSIRALLLAMTIAGSTLSATASAPEPPCVLVQVPAVGRACRTADGLWKVPVGGGRYVTTHGADPLRPVPGDRPVAELARASSVREVAGWPMARPVCSNSPATEFHHHVIYAHPADRPSAYSYMRLGVKRMVYGANGFLRATSARFGRSLQYRVLCAGGDVAVAHVKLKVADADASFERIVSDLISQGYSSTFAKYWVFYDGPTRGGAAGVGTFQRNDTPGADNPNNYGPGWAVTFNSGIHASLRTMMHENGHNLGAVQESSPNSNRVGHCNDGLDVMCYFEPTAFGRLYRTDRCRNQEYDCRSDDYFNPRPRAGSYLATHWNTASPVNRFLAGCVYRTGTLIAPGTAAAPAPRVSTADITIPKTCQGRPFSVSAVPQFPTASTTAFSVLPPRNDQTTWVGPLALSMTSAARLPDADVCFYKGATLLRCIERRGVVELAQRRLSATATGAESGTIPAGATLARVVLAAGAHAVYVFNAV